MPDSQKNPDIDPALPQQALKTLRSLIKGNGIKTQALTLKQCEGEVLNFDARTLIKISSKTTSSTLPGKISGGTVCQSSGELNTAVEKALKDVASSDTSSDKVAKTILERPDKGFGLFKEQIKLPSFDQEFFVHENCPKCQGKKQTACVNCRGQKQIKCIHCRGLRHMPCKHCRSTGFIQTPNGKREKCRYCRGRGKTTCTYCHGKGMMLCPKCQGKGFAQCPTCNGTGGQTQKTQLEVYADLSFQYDQQELPQDLCRILDKNASSFVKQDNIKLQLQDLPAEEKAKIPEDLVVINYRAALPYAKVRFTLKDETFDGILCGYQGKLLNLPPFLEQIAEKGFHDISFAAANRGDVAKQIKLAARFRLLRDILVQTALHKPQKAIGKLKKRYPYGITEQTLKLASLNADKAYKNITRKPRYIGMGIGLVLTALFYGLYYLGPLRGIASPFLQTALNQMIVDLLIIFIGGALTTSSIQITASRALQNAVGQFLPPQYRNKLKPRAGKSAIWGYIGGLCLYFLMIEITAHTENPTPVWYLSLKHMIGL